MFLDRIEFARDPHEDHSTRGKFSLKDMNILIEFGVAKDESDHESVKRYFLDLTKKYFDGKTPLEGKLPIVFYYRV